MTTTTNNNKKGNNNKENQKQNNEKKMKKKKNAADNCEGSSSLTSSTASTASSSTSSSSSSSSSSFLSSGLFNNKKKKSKKQQRKKSVKFCSQVCIRETISIRDMSEEEIDNVWLSFDEMQEIRQRCKSIANNYYLFARRLTKRYNRNKFKNDEEEDDTTYYRGLESCTPHTKGKKKMNRQEAFILVLDEVDRQYNTNSDNYIYEYRNDYYNGVRYSMIYDEEEIKSLYQEISTRRGVEVEVEVDDDELNDDNDDNIVITATTKPKEQRSEINAAAVAADSSTYTTTTTTATTSTAHFSSSAFIVKKSSSSSSSSSPPVSPLPLTKRIVPAAAVAA